MFRYVMAALLLSACSVEVTNEGHPEAEADEECADCGEAEDGERFVLEVPEEPPTAPERVEPAEPETTCVEGAECAPWPGFAGWTYVCAIGQAPPSATCAAVEPGVFCCP